MMKLLRITIYKANGCVDGQRFVVDDNDFENNDRKYIYNKYIKSYLDKYKQGEIMEWEAKWELDF